MVSERVGSVFGFDKSNRYCVVSVYRDRDAYKLCGPTGSCLVDGPIEAVVAAANREYAIADAWFAPTVRS